MAWRATSGNSSTAARRPKGESSAPSKASTRLEELFDHHHQRLYRLALRMLGDPEEARDLMQDTFLRLALSPRRVPASASGAEAWLVRTLINLSRDRFRRKRVREAAAWRIDDEEGAFAAPDSAVVARATLEKALNALPARRRAVLVLRELEGCSSAETARLMGLARPTVRWHLAAARKQLKQELQALEGGGQR